VDTTHPFWLTLVLGRWLLVGDDLVLDCFDLDSPGVATLMTRIPANSTHYLESRVVTNSEGLHSTFVISRGMDTL